jgi:multiple RNA-binding domain-containing protein 1
LKKKDKVKKVEEVKEDLDEKDENLQLKIEEKISDTGRLFVRNLSYICTEDDIKQLFEPHGALAEIQCIIDKKTGKCKGFAIVTYIFPENALVAYKELDGSIFKVYN